MSGAMKVDGKNMRSIWLEADGWSVGAIDQSLLPHRFATIRLTTLDDAARAIATMQVRGAPLIGATAAYGVCLALRADASDEALERAFATLMATRPTAINLKWALEEMVGAVRNRPREERVAAAYRRAAEICDEDVAINRAIGGHGAALIAAIAAKKPPAQPVQVLTHCNAGWLATVDFGTALAPIYVAHDRGVPLHVWVDETRPYLQGARLTAWELAQAGVPHTLIADMAAGYLMARGEVDVVIVGADRVAANGDTANKIGTYTLAVLAARHGIPFFVCAPTTSIDLEAPDGAAIPIEERAAEEVSTIRGVAIAPLGTEVRNPAFDVTPAELITGIVTEEGVVRGPLEDGLRAATAAAIARWTALPGHDRPARIPPEPVVAAG